MSSKFWSDRRAVHLLEWSDACRVLSLGEPNGNHEMRRLAEISRDIAALEAERCSINRRIAEQREDADRNAETA